MYFMKIKSMSREADGSGCRLHFDCKNMLINKGGIIIRNKDSVHTFDQRQCAYEKRMLMLAFISIQFKI